MYDFFLFLVQVVLFFICCICAANLIYFTVLSVRCILGYVPPEIQRMRERLGQREAKNKLFESMIKRAYNDRKI